MSDSLVCCEFAESRDATDLEGSRTELGLSRKPAAKRLNGVHGQVDQNLSGDVIAGAHLDDLFADWSTDPLQLLLSDAR